MVAVFDVAYVVVGKISRFYILQQLTIPVIMIPEGENYFSRKQNAGARKVGSFILTH